MTTIDIKNKVLTHLISAVTVGETQFPIELGDYSSILGGTEGDIYLVLRGPTAREIVKVDPAASSWGNYIKVARGQGGTTPRAWQASTILFASTTAEFYNSVLQKGTARTISYNPNEILTPLFQGEKVYQSSPAGFVRWWKAWDGVNPYWDLITGAPGAGEDYTDIGWTYDILKTTAQQQSFISLASDGYLWSLDPLWANAYSGTGLTVDDTDIKATCGAYFSAANYQVFRTFFFFDLSGFTITTVSAALLSLTRSMAGGTVCPIAVQGASMLPPLTTGHWASPTGPLLSNDMPDIISGSEYKEWNFNSAGFAFIENALSSVPGNILCIAMMQYPNDILNVAADQANYGKWETVENSGVPDRPKILITGS